MVLTGFSIALNSGCASSATSPEAQPDIDASPSAGQKSSRLTTDEGNVGGVTRFTEESLAALVDDDFWNTGMVAQRDDDGRLVYVNNTDAINDPERTRQELAFYQLRSEPNTWASYGYDPVTGRLIRIAPRQYRTTGVGRVPASAVPDQRQVVPRTPAPRVRPLRPASPQPRLPTRDAESNISRR